jgi:glutamate-ammonia-ligase adenylyltransferase
MIGYGKLGGIEMGYGSDLDLVFLHNAQADEMTPGEKSISNGQFFARLGQRIITLLTVFTTAGELYEVDMRLRPSGNSGLLVSSTEAFVRYQQDQAWLWEKQALVRARPVAGSESLGQWFEAMRKTILCEARQETEVARQVLEMRQKMWQSADASSDDFDLKKSPGGITDIEFMVQYLVLAHAHVHSSLVTYTDNIRILEQLAACGVIPAEAETRLADIYRLFRDDIHRLTLQGLPPRVADEKHAGARDYVRQCWRDWLELKANE